MTGTTMGTIEELFDAAAEAYAEQRSAPRERFRRPAKVRTGCGQEHDAFTRNISAHGIGLRHDQPLMPGLAGIEIDQESGAIELVKAEILWCCRQGDHYVSGARFLQQK